MQISHMKSQNLNPNSLRSRFTSRFIRALGKINAEKPVSTSSPREIFVRYQRIKVAADKSMAFSVRSRRRWSRAMLWKLQSRRSCLRRRRLLQPSSSSSSSVRKVKSTTAAIIKAKTAGGHDEKEKKTTKTAGEDQAHGFGEEAEELREIVPGGEAMDLCNLLDETAHYIKCLTTQVQVMRKIVDFYSL